MGKTLSIKDRTQSFFGALEKFYFFLAEKKFFSRLFFLLWIFHGAIIFNYAVDLPFYDEWSYFRFDGLPEKWSWEWIWRQHNEHRIIWTKLLTSFSYHWEFLNFRHLIFFNWILYSLILYCVFLLMPSMERYSKEIKCSFLLFLLSPLLSGNHQWAFQSQFHFCLLFALCATLAIWPKNGTRHGSTPLLLLPLLAMPLAFSSGLPISWLVWGLWGISLLLFSASRRRAFALFFVAGLSLGILSIFWASNYESHSTHQLAWPWIWRFWRYVFHISAMGFGILAEWQLAGAIVFIFALLPWALSFKKKSYRSFGADHCRSLALVLIALGGIGLIAFGRGLEGWGSKSSRYFEYAVLLVPATIGAWVLHAKSKSRWIVSSAWFLIFLIYLPSWGRFQDYSRHHQLLQEGKKCLAENLSPGPLLCEKLYPADIKQFLERAHSLKIHFTRDFPR